VTSAANRIGIGQVVQTLANIGVIAGIAFLILELRQNNELMESEARFDRLSVSREAFNILSTNGELAGIMVKVDNNEPLTDVERYRSNMAQMRFLSNMDWMLREMPDDSPERQYAERQLERTLVQSPLSRELFMERREDFSPEFVEWIRANILAP
jgi:hypothetical protein